MKKKLITIFVTTIVFGCGHSINKNSNTQKNDTANIHTNGAIITTESKKGAYAEAATKDEKIINKYWKLKTLQGKAIKMTENQEREQYFILKSDGSMSGFAGCNLLNGTYELQKGNRIRFNENMAVTMKICPDFDINESDFLEVFKLADNYNINGDTLNLNVGRRAALAVFEVVYF